MDLQGAALMALKEAAEVHLMKTFEGPNIFAMREECDHYVQGPPASPKYLGCQ